VLTIDILTKIYDGSIDNWRDKEILSLQSDEVKNKIPDKKIRVLVRQESSGSTTIFSSSFAAYSKEWSKRYGTFSVWPKELTKKVNYVETTGNNGMFATVESTPYSIGYLSLAFLVDNQQLSYALLKTSEGVVSADYNNIEPVIQASTLDELNTADLVAVASELLKKNQNVWPLSGFTYILIDASDNFDGEECRMRRAMFKWFRWTLTDENAKSRAIKKGYAILSGSIAAQVLEELEQVTCNGDKLLQRKLFHPFTYLVLITTNS